MQAHSTMPWTRILRTFVVWTLCLFALAIHTQAFAESPSVLVLGGASHTQAEFSDPRIEQFYLTTAVNSAESLARALTSARVRNTKFIDWSRSPGYLQDLGINIAACDCNFLMQVSFGKNVDANPQTLFFEYQLLYLAKAESKQPGMRASQTEERFLRKFEVSISDLRTLTEKYEGFSKDVVADMVKANALFIAESP